jgi:glutaminyl-tRNA synthetase
VINTFCNAIGVSRKGNENLTDYRKLEYYCRKELDSTAPRTFGVTQPVLLEIVNLQEVQQISAPLFPADPSRGCQVYTLTKNVYIESEDFSETVKEGFFGVMPGQTVCLRYGPHVRMLEVVRENGLVSKVLVEQVTPDKKVKGVIHWVSKEHSLTCQVNQYNVLLTEEDVIGAAIKANCDFTKFVNPESLLERKQAKVWNLHKDAKVYDRFQFERVGYFCVDQDSLPGRLIFNSIVALKESAAKKGKK